MCERVKLTPLTPEEKAFAEENHSVLVWYLNTHNLDRSEYYDVAAMGYLQAVKQWFARPELHQWSFSTIARQSMRSRVHNERQKQNRLPTVSLNDVVPGTEDLTYGESITYENQRFFKQERKIQMGMKINYDVTVPAAAKVTTRTSVEVETLLSFLESTHKTLSFEYDTPKEAIKKCGTLRTYKRSHKHTGYNVYRQEETVYIEKEKTGRK